MAEVKKQSYQICLKQAHISAIIKKSGLDTENFANYRPVSNLSFISKLIEKVVAEQVERHLQSHSLHDMYQSAYRKKHSTETALLKVKCDIRDSLDQGDFVALVMLDLSAAFDIVSHDSLLKRLNDSFGIKGQVLRWFTSYLDQRRQNVIINGAESIGHSLDCGVPQGSVLGPKLFSMYIKPLGDIITKHGFRYHQYADDSQIYLAFKPKESLAHISERIKICIQDVGEWMASNMLMLNREKTDVILFAPKHKSLLDNNFSLAFGNVTINAKKVVRSLGVVLDTTLSMEHHVNAVSRSCFMHLKNISKIRKYLTVEATKSLVHAVVMSRLDYCNSLLLDISDTHINKLQRVQNYAARVISKTPRRDHITPVLKSLHWLPVKNRIVFKVLVLVYQSLHNLSPTYIQDFIVPYKPPRPLRSQNQNEITVNKCHTVSYGDASFKHSAPKLWNRLPIGIKNATTLSTFKKNLKTHLFSQYYT